MGADATSSTSTDLAALERLYRSEYERTVRLARLLTNDHHVAEELAQEAFVRVAPRIEAADNPAAYLRTVTVNLCRDHGRRVSTARRHPDPPAAMDHAPPLPRDVEEVWMAVQALTPARRDALVLRYWADLPTAEVARLLDVRPATARSLIRRGLASLQEVLSDVDR
ncbi:MAG: sigma-70 family RNA polymerase sigma factor [Acidimicrobiales bacterium]|nr:sigma-70 family RNA polymerase sigma factor [Acidimicrobiales bacterium]